MARRLENWASVELADLLIAFKKAKTDVFYERSINVAESFAAYELNLSENLVSLLLRLQQGEVEAILLEQPGRANLVPKRLNMRPKDRTSDPAFRGHSYFSDAPRAFESLSRGNFLEPEFRLVGLFSVEVFIISALWINHVGHQYDARLTDAAYGSRLRRSSTAEDAPYSDEALGSFQPYQGPYRRWRDGGLAAIRSSLELGFDVVAATLDITSYYHNVDARFLIDVEFNERIGVNLNWWERQFTAGIVRFIRRWSSATRAIYSDLLGEEDEVGLPIGLPAVKIIANVFLHSLDQEMQSSLGLIYYGRYVDDIFIVISESAVESPEGFWSFIRQRVPYFQMSPEQNDAITLQIPFGYRSNLVLQQRKQKLFFLSGTTGIDLLKNIESEIGELSSERRMMPLSDSLDRSPSARILASSDNPTEEAIELGHADGLRLRRLGWALQLRAVETLSRDLHPDDWVQERGQFYQFAIDHVFRPERTLESTDQAARLISLAVSLSDWTDATRIFSAALNALSRLEGHVQASAHYINGRQIDGRTSEIWSRVLAEFKASCREAVLRALPWAVDGSAAIEFSDAAVELLEQLGFEAEPGYVVQRAESLRITDWSLLSYKELLRLSNSSPRRPTVGEESLVRLMPNSVVVEEYLSRTREQHPVFKTRRLGEVAETAERLGEASVLALLLANRPYTPEEIALYLPDECVFAPGPASSHAWGVYVAAFRGIGPYAEGILRSPSPHQVSAFDNQTVQIGSVDLFDLPMLGISSLETTDASWTAAAQGGSDLSKARYDRICEVVNAAISANPRPNYLLLPELSLPEAWISTVADKLTRVGVSLIAGLDYQRSSSTTLHSSAVMVLTDDRLGFSNKIQLRQPKYVPGPNEIKLLSQTYHLSWTEWPQPPLYPTYVHRGLYFSVLICSELQNVTTRSDFRGKIDALFVLSWNQDLDTFSALVESASLDLHASVALVNNRRYGDSRVRVPAREAYARDSCRIRGGLNEQVVVVRLHTWAYRYQQLRQTRWNEDDDIFKPVPEGFVISPQRGL